MKFKLLLVDLDGVVWRGGRIVRENVEWLRSARDKGASIVFVTNNSTRSRRIYADRLSAILGYTVSVEDVYTSGYALARLLYERYGPQRVLVIGEEGLVEELVLQGHSVVNVMDGARCPIDFVVVGLDRSFNYHKLRAAHTAVKRCGAKIAVANMDNVVPVENGDVPGAGAIVSSIVSSTSQAPVIVAGKPEPYMFLAALREKGVGREEALAIGDRCDTDVEAARRADIPSVLVLTGVAGEMRQVCNADYVVGKLTELEL
ncbi:MAG: hypothetical protein DSY37_00655 [Hyperthermus sp.]|nr:MAG: hypothetical protein DSY37_00655 [Hyperthermus sp.]